MFGGEDIIFIQCLGLLFVRQLIMGVGIRSVFTINKVSILKQVWRVVCHNYSCWNIWVYAKYNRDKSFWEIPVVAFASWGWRGILSLRALARPYIRHLIGNGMLTSFWVDYCVDGRSLIEQYGDQVVYDLGMGKNVKVSSFIHDDTWCFPPTSSIDFINIWQ